MDERRTGNERRTEPRPDGGERRRGRPPSAQPGSTICTWVPVTEHDRILRLAKDQRVSVSEFVREAIKRAS